MRLAVINLQNLFDSAKAMKQTDWISFSLYIPVSPALDRQGGLVVEGAECRSCKCNRLRLPPRHEFSMGMPAKPMNDEFGKESGRFLANPLEMSYVHFGIPNTNPVALWIFSSVVGFTQSSLLPTKTGEPAASNRYCSAKKAWTFGFSEFSAFS